MAIHILSLINFGEGIIFITVIISNKYLNLIKWMVKIEQKIEATHRTQNKLVLFICVVNLFLEEVFNEWKYC